MRVEKSLWLVVAGFLMISLLVACSANVPTGSEPVAPAATLSPATEAPVASPAVQSPAATTTPESVPVPVTSAGEVSFARDVLPILQNKCINCHGGQRTAEGLDMKTYDALMAGSENGSVITPGDSTRSSFITLSAEGKMPKRGPKLTAEELRLLTDWVNAGAPNN
ncbi:MAG: hypothetical protein N2117_01830 [Anaerolineales bacterium]|nr:hypothetical protein [Anaerolineales bacterium]MCX7753970.1 hypothetical protein [Anaerolineales bacterium]MDW8276822.1 c-type cytochrome domain-containing protein [Anaerolineales bacterium]